MAYAFIPSSLMLGLTAHLTTDFPPVPMLWLVPLSLYLLSFIVSFAARTILPRRWLVRMMGPALLVLAYQLVASGPPSVAQWSFLFGAFFVLALGFHGELKEDRPGTEHLTEFYLWISLGGALGGVFNSLMAPRLFSWVAEYPLAMVAAGLLLPALQSCPPDADVDGAGLADSRRIGPGRRFLGLVLMGHARACPGRRGPVSRTGRDRTVEIPPAAAGLPGALRPALFGSAWPWRRSWPPGTSGWTRTASCSTASARSSECCG